MRKISFGVLVLILLCGCSGYREATSAETEDKQKEKTELISFDDSEIKKQCDEGL